MPAHSPNPYRSPATHPSKNLGGVSAGELAAEVAVALLLIAIAVVGRWSQPFWNFTPLAAIALFAGAYFRRRAIAIAVPLAALAISNLILDGYPSQPVMLSVYGLMGATALIGPWLRRAAAGSAGGWIARVAVGAAAPSLAFFLVTNFAVWASTGMYAKTFAGLIECYTAAVPFYRQQLAGDLFYTAVLFGAAAWVGVAAFSTVSEPSINRAA